MPLFGAHMSIAGGLHNALLAATAHGCDTVQLFVSTPKAWPVAPGPAGWTAKDLDEEDVLSFRQTLRRSRLRYPTAHDSYLINLASPDDALYRRSIEAFLVELQRCERLGIRYLVMHPGAHMGSGEDAGLTRIARAIDEVHARTPGYRVRILLETTAGQGTNLGFRFEHLGRILALIAEPQRLGVCLDTCHVFAAGYALAPEAEYRATMRVFDKVIGLKRLLAFHANDSLKPFGSRVDRHAHIGKGHIGIEAFRFFVNDPRFRDRPFLLETPKEENSTDMDAVNLGVLRGLLLDTTPSRGRTGTV